VPHDCTPSCPLSHLHIVPLPRPSPQIILCTWQV
jgi:hypothetical protein